MQRSNMFAAIVTFVLAASASLASVAVAATVPPAGSIDVASATCGSFGVPAAAEGGIVVRNSGDCPLYVKFNPTGRWSYSTDRAFVPACGIPYARANLLKYPNLNLGALALTHDDVYGESVDADKEFVINAHDFVLLQFNDIPGQYGDNQGAISVEWTTSTQPMNP